jgi:hypothetical protein
MEVRELPQKVRVMLAPDDDVVEVVAGCDRGASHQQQDLLEGDAPGLTVILELGKVVQKQTQTRMRDVLVEHRVHGGACVRVRAPTESHRFRQHKIRRFGRSPELPAARFVLSALYQS